MSHGLQSLQQEISQFPEYEEKIAKTQEKTGLSEGIVIGKTKIYGEETVLGVIDSRFMMGSMVCGW